MIKFVRRKRIETTQGLFLRLGGIFLSSFSKEEESQIARNSRARQDSFFLINGAPFLGVGLGISHLDL